jgi:hypothetical protein
MSSSAAGPGPAIPGAGVPIPRSRSTDQRVSARSVRARRGQSSDLQADIAATLRQHENAIETVNARLLVLGSETAGAAQALVAHAAATDARILALAAQAATTDAQVRWLALRRCLVRKQLHAWLQSWSSGIKPNRAHHILAWQLKEEQRRCCRS